MAKTTRIKSVFWIMVLMIFAGAGLWVYGYYSHTPKVEKFIVEVPYELKLKDVEEIISSNNPVVDPEIRPIIARIMLQECDLGEVDPAITAAQISVESNFNPLCVGAQGEMGLMQLHPDHQAETIKASGLKRYEVFYIRNNIRIGVRYYKQQLKRFGSVALALSAYNAGPNATTRAGKIPNRQAEDYVRSVLSAYAQIKNTYKGDKL